MLEQRGNLGVDRRRHILDVVGLVRLEQQQRRRPVRGDGLLGEEQRVSRGDDAVRDEEAGVAMVRVEAVALPRIVTDDDIRADRADRSTYLPSLAQPGLQLSVRPAQEGHRGSAAEGRCSRNLLLLARHDELRGVLGGIPGATRAVGAHEVVDIAACCGPLRKCATAAELDVVRMGPDGEGASGRREVGRVHWFS